MSEPDSISQLIAALKAGDDEAVAQIWERYFLRLVELACLRLRSFPRRAADEEDVVAAALESFFQRARAGHFPDLHDRDGLWRLLVSITERKVSNLRRNEGRQKRGGGKVRGDSAFPRDDMSHGKAVARSLVDGAPSPELAAVFTDEVRRLLNLLGDDTLRDVATFKLEGYTNKEIAEKMGCSLANIERRLRLIRRTWSNDQE
jgi:DNA-directed RNA polymerase specialized sigma24 family protein